LYKKVLSAVLKPVSDVLVLTLASRLFQMFGAAKEKARLAKAVQLAGTARLFDDDERNDRAGIY
jgi:hypothetical protein